MVEAPANFEAHRHLLLTLQRMDPDELPQPLARALLPAAASFRSTTF